MDQVTSTSWSMAEMWLLEDPGDCPRILRKFVCIASMVTFLLPPKPNNFAVRFESVPLQYLRSPGTKWECAAYQPTTTLVKRLPPQKGSCRPGRKLESSACYLCWTSRDNNYMGNSLFDYRKSRTFEGG